MTCASSASSETAQYDPIAELYDGYPGNYLEDIPFFVEEAGRAGSPVLEIGVGTGRLALCLAAAGVEVVGIDSSPAMLRVLRRRLAQFPHLKPQVRAVAADMRRFALREKFRLALVPFRTFLYLLTREDQRRALRAIRAHLEPGGRVVLAFFVPRRELISRGRTEPAEMARFAGPDGATISAWDWTELLADQRVVSHITYRWLDEQGSVIRELEHALTARYVRPEEMPPLFEECGFRVAARYGDFGRGPLTADSREQIWVAERIEKVENEA